MEFVIFGSSFIHYYNRTETLGQYFKIPYIIPEVLYTYAYEYILLNIVEYEKRV